jgi:F-type H+-transporting ATPase subunit b
MGLNFFEDGIAKFETFIGVNPFTMIFAWVNLLIIYLFMKKLLFVPIKNMIDQRQKEIDDMYSDAEADKKNAEAMRCEYEEKLSHANEESDEILKKAQRRAQLREEEILAEANKKAERTLERAEEQIELEKKQAINDVKNQISDMAIGIAAAVIERDVKADEHTALIYEFINGIGN